MSRVTLMEECPSISETTLGLTSLESKSVAQVVEADLKVPAQKEHKRRRPEQWFRIACPCPAEHGRLSAC